MLSSDFQQLYAPNGRPSIPPEKLLRALLRQALHSVRSERQLMEQLDKLLFRWFVRLGVDDPVRDVIVFTKYPDWLPTGESRLGVELGLEFAARETAKHAIGEYVRDDVHTNSAEGAIATLRRSVGEVYRHCTRTSEGTVFFKVRRTTNL